MDNNPANGIKDLMWRFLMDKGQKENIPELKASVYRLLKKLQGKENLQHIFRGKHWIWKL